MTSTSFNIGLDNTGKNSSRVLKPPGGGTSELFATQNEEDKARILQGDIIPALNQEQSIGTDKPGNDSRNCSQYPNGNQNPDNIHSFPWNAPLILANMEGDDTVEEAAADTDPAKAEGLDKNDKYKIQVSSIERNCVTGDGCQTNEHYAIRVHRQRDGNPVTGEGYDLPKSTVNQKVNGVNSAAPAAPSRTRVPPGGYSSGLW